MKYFKYLQFSGRITKNFIFPNLFPDISHALYCSFSNATRKGIFFKCYINYFYKKTAKFKNKIEMRYLLAQQFRIYNKNKNWIVSFSGDIELFSYCKKKMICSICAKKVLFHWNSIYSNYFQLLDFSYYVKNFFFDCLQFRNYNICYNHITAIIITNYLPNF